MVGPLQRLFQRKRGWAPTLAVMQLEVGSIHSGA